MWLGFFEGKSCFCVFLQDWYVVGIGGHGNALGGTVTDTGCFNWESYPNIFDTYKSDDYSMWGITQIKKKGLRDMGGALGPEAAHHLAVGSETLPLRLDRACDNALALAEFCESHPRIKKTFYPGLNSHPQYQRAGICSRNTGQFSPWNWPTNWIVLNFSTAWIPLYVRVI